MAPEMIKQENRDVRQTFECWWTVLNMPATRHGLLLELIQQ